MVGERQPGGPLGCGHEGTQPRKDRTGQRIHGSPSGGEGNRAAGRWVGCLEARFWSADGERGVEFLTIKEMHKQDGFQLEDE